MKATITGMAAALALALAFSISLGQAEMKAPDFTATDCCGKKFSLSDYQGKVVVLEWMNPGCPFVQRHYKEGTFKKLAESYAGRGVTWLAVNSTSGISAEESHNWSEQYQLSYPILVDQNGEIGKLYKAKTTPHMFVIGKDGQIVYDGAVDDDPSGSKDQRTSYVQQAIDAALARVMPATRETKSYGCGVKYPE